MLQCVCTPDSDLLTPFAKLLPPSSRFRPSLLSYPTVLMVSPLYFRSAQHVFPASLASSHQFTAQFMVCPAHSFPHRGSCSTSHTRVRWQPYHPIYSPSLIATYLFRHSRLLDVFRLSISPLSLRTRPSTACPSSTPRVQTPRYSEVKFALTLVSEPLSFNSCSYI